MDAGRNIRMKVRKAARFLLVSLCISLFLSGASLALGPGWKPFVKRQPQGALTGSALEALREKLEFPPDRPSIPLSTSETHKLFWIDCGYTSQGPREVCAGSLWFVDPAAPVPAPTLFDDGIFFGMYDDDDLEDYFIPLGKVGADYAMSNLRIGYVIYFKNGGIYLADAKTLSVKQLSNETGIKPWSDGSDPVPGLLCNSRLLINWANPNKTTFAYWLAGSDGECWTQDDSRRAVTLDMDASDPPVFLGPMNVDSILLDGRYVLTDYSTYPWKVLVCSLDDSQCTEVAQYYSWLGVEDLDRSYVIMRVDEKIQRLNLARMTTSTIYTVDGTNEVVSDIELDRDGMVYLLSSSTKPVGYNNAYVNEVKRITPKGAVKTLASFVTNFSLASDFERDTPDMNLTPDRIVYEYPDITHSAMLLRSLPKSGGKPAVLANDAVMGGAVGQYYYYEDTFGRLHRVSLDGKTRIFRADMQLNGGMQGITGDWYYGMSPSAGRFAATDGSRNTWSYAMTEDFSVRGSGKLLGTLPVNVTNLNVNGCGKYLVSTVQRRNEGFSYGRDIFLVDTGRTPSPMRRLTNSNGMKYVADDIN